MHRQTYAEVDLLKLERNFRALRGLSPAGGFCCPMVKANAYGHGDVEVAARLELSGARHIGVGLVEEGVRLREAGVKAPLLLFGAFEGPSLEAVLANALTPVIGDWDGLALLEKSASGDAFKLHLKFNTGMNRLGFGVDQAPRLRAWLDARPRFRLEGVATHLLRGEDAGFDDGDSRGQLERFEEALAAFRGLEFFPHALNSSAAVAMHAREGRLRYGMRPGLALYGITPASREAPKLGFEPVLSFRSRVVATRRLRPGEKVSYDGLWTAKRPSLVGVVPVGYADGFQRLFSNTGEVLCRGRRARVAGAVCMDYFMVDLTDVEAATGEVGNGEEIALIGEQSGAEIGAVELARWASTIPYEVLTRLSERVPRHYVR